VNVLIPEPWHHDAIIDIDDLVAFGECASGRDYRFDQAIREDNIHTLARGIT
jgi:hypothetical protein